MNARYKLIKNSRIIDNTRYMVYGIECYYDNNYYDSFYDIVLNKSEAQEICDFLNKHNISPVHFIDIVEDFIAK